MVFDATFNNISVILWLSVLLMEESGIPGENHQRVRVRVDNSAYKTLVHKLKIGFYCYYYYSIDFMSCKAKLSFYIFSFFNNSRSIVHMSFSSMT
jgi:hypothetical protein